MCSKTRSASLLKNARPPSFYQNLRIASLLQRTSLMFSIQNVRAEPESPHPQRLEADLFNPPAMDLKDYLTKKRNIHQITSQCCCERLITMVLSECHCSLHTSNQSALNQLSAAPISNSAKRATPAGRELSLTLT